MKAHYIFFRAIRFIKRNILSALLVVMLVVVTSCIKKDDFDFDKLADSQYNGEWAVPLINSNLTLEDLLNDSASIITTDANNFLKVYYQSDVLYSLYAYEVIDIPDQQIVSSDTLVYPPLPVGTKDSIKITTPYSISPDKPGQRLDSVFIKSGSLQLNMTSQINHTFDMELRIPSFTKNGQDFVISLQHNYTGSLPVILSQSIDLSGYVLRPNNSGGKVNEILLAYVLFVEGDNNPLQNPYTIDFNADLVNLDFSRFFGYLGQYTFPLGDTLDLELFTNSLSGSVQINELKVNINTHNAYGMPVDVNINQFNATSNNNTVIDILAPSSNIPLPAPNLAQVGQTIDTSYLFDENNSGIVNAINNLPKNIIFNVTGISNPAGNPALSNFVLDTSRFSLDMNIELPMFGSVAGFIIQDTLDFKLETIDEIESASFAVNSTNGFPIDASVQIYFADENYQILDSLMDTPNIIEAGVVGPAPDYKVVTPTKKSVVVTLNRNRLDAIASTKKILISGEISTYQQSDVKLYSTDYIDIQVGVKTKLSTSF